jgi:hypothetical protein
LQTVAGWHTRTPSEVRTAQQPEAQSLLRPHSDAHTAGAPAQAVGDWPPPVVSKQQSESCAQAPPAATVQPTGERHHCGAVQTLKPLVSCAQQPLWHTELSVHSEEHSWPTPRRSAHIA